MWDLPYNAHRFFIEPLGGPHAKVILMCKYVNFIQNVNKSSKKAMIFLLHRSIKILTLLQEEILSIFSERQERMIFLN